jgi:hypothetical protein
MWSSKARLGKRKGQFSIAKTLRIWKHKDKGTRSYLNQHSLFPA